MFHSILTGLLAGLGLSLSVGPVVFAIIRYSLMYGPRSGVSFVLGVNFSDILFILMSLWMSSYLEKLGEYQYWIGLVGAVIFVIVGLYGYFRKENLFKYRNQEINYASNNLIKLWMSGFFFNLFNPGAIAMWLTTNLMVLSYSYNEKIAFFAALLMMILLSDLFKVFLAGQLRKKLTLRRSVQLNKISSLIIVGLGVAILIRTLIFVQR